MDITDLQDFVETVPFLRMLGMRLIDTEGGVTFAATIGSDFVLDGAVVHGGIVASLLDTAATFALIGASGHDWTTVDLRVDYLRPTPPGSVSVRGEVVRRGRTIGRSRAELVDADGKTSATAIATFVPNTE
jgi:uncharacterized protein (TIGR00369 family)